MDNKFYITTAVDYINAKPHIGHAYEKVAADVLARFYSEKFGRDRVRFLTGTDEHGSKIAKAAEAAGKEVKEFANETSAKFSFAWEQLNIVPDRFIRTTDADHIKIVGKLLQNIKNNGYLEEALYEGYYCTACEAFYTEVEAPEHICPIHKTPLELIKEKNWFLKIHEFTGQIEDAIQSNKLKIWPTSARHEILTLLKKGFTDISISRPNVKWGIPLPWDESQTVYVWVDALINYYTGAKSDRGDWWPADVHIIGKDISKFHCIIWPAILLAAGLELPKQVVVHGYLTVGGEKISKSIGNVIDPNDWVAKYGADAVRYFLLREIAFGQDGDVSEEKLKTRYVGELANGLGNLVSRVTAQIERFSQVNLVLDKTVPLSYDLDKHKDKPFWVDNLIEGFYFHQALQDIFTAVAMANEIVDRNKYWELPRTNPEKFTEISKELLNSLNQIAEKLKPFMPETSQKILKIIRAEKIIKPEPLFPRIEN